MEPEDRNKLIGVLLDDPEASHLVVTDETAAYVSDVPKSHYRGITYPAFLLWLWPRWFCDRYDWHLWDEVESSQYVESGRDGLKWAHVLVCDKCGLTVHIDWIEEPQETVWKSTQLQTDWGGSDEL